MRTPSTARRVRQVGIDTRVNGYDWTTIAEHLDAYGWATFPKLLTASEADTIARLYEDDRMFRSRVVMARHGFGRGEYKYFKYPCRRQLPSYGRRYIRAWSRSPIDGTRRWVLTSAIRTRMPIS
jgi:hypothetical protein